MRSHHENKSGRRQLRQVKNGSSPQSIEAPPSRVSLQKGDCEETQRTRSIASCANRSKNHDRTNHEENSSGEVSHEKYEKFRGKRRRHSLADEGNDDGHVSTHDGATRYACYSPNATNSGNANRSVRDKEFPTLPERATNATNDQLRKKLISRKAREDFTPSSAADVGTSRSTCADDSNFASRVEWLDVGALRPSPRNARLHSKAQIKAIARSIKKFGFTNPILVHGRNEIVAGHGRLAAAVLLGLKRVPVLRLEGLSKADVQAYALADNRLAELAEWDNDLITEIVEEILEIDETYDLELTGFAVAELDRIVSEQERAGGQVESDPAADTLPDTFEGPPISALGDLWQLGCHRLWVGSATDPGACRRLLGRRRAEAVITDPPYNVRIEGFASGKGRKRHRDFVMAAGEMSPEAFRQLLAAFLQEAKGACEPGAMFHVFMDWRHFADLQASAASAGLELLNMCVWVKPRGGMGSLYRSQHELVGVFGSREYRQRNNVELGRHGRNRTNVWHYDSPSSLTRSGKAALGLHPTVKPVAMIADAILDVTKPGGIVLDPFLGSGSTIIAAEKTRRVACGIELDPAYVDIAIRRWQGYTGEMAVLASSGETWPEVAQRRLREQGLERAAIEAHPALQPLDAPERHQRASASRVTATRSKGGRR